MFPFHIILTSRNTLQARLEMVERRQTPRASNAKRRPPFIVHGFPKDRIIIRLERHYIHSRRLHQFSHYTVLESSYLKHTGLYSIMHHIPLPSAHCRLHSHPDCPPMCSVEYMNARLKASDNSTLPITPSFLLDLQAHTFVPSLQRKTSAARFLKRDRYVRGLVSDLPVLTSLHFSARRPLSHRITEMHGLWSYLHAGVASGATRYVLRRIAHPLVRH